jgi:hypothetical protein
LMPSGANTADLITDILPNGNEVSVKYAVPEGFLEPGRIVIEAHERDLRHDPVIFNKATAMKAASEKLRKTCEEIRGRAYMSFKIPLPIQVKNKFRLPPFIATYDHDYKKERMQGNCYHVLHLDFESLVEPRVRNLKVKGGKSKFASPLGQRGLDEDSDDSTDDDDSRDGRHAPPAVVDNENGGRKV